MNYKIREALPGDITEIINLCGEHAEYERVEYLPDCNAGNLSAILFAEAPKLFCLIAESEGKIIGYATYAFEVSTWDAGIYTNMDCLFLRPHARGFGIGEELVKRIARHSKKNNSHLMQWITPSFNERAITFYYRLGATSKKKVKLYLDEEAMSKLIK